MIDPRPHMLGIGVGEKFIGKTNTTFGAVLDVLRGNVSQGIMPRSTLIVDYNNEYGNIRYFRPDGTFQDYIVPALAPEHIAWFSEHNTKNVRRITPFDKKGNIMSREEKKDLLYYVLENFANGFLLVEDPRKTTGFNLTEDMVDKLVSHRHSNTDLMLHYQALGLVPPQIFENCSYIRLHAQGTGVKRIKEKVSEYFLYLQIAKEIVDQRWINGDKRFYLYYNKDTRTIDGDFTTEEAEKAILQTIANNRNEMLIPKMNLMDRGGKLIHKNPKTAIDEIITEYMRSVRATGDERL